MNVRFLGFLNVIGAVLILAGCMSAAPPSNSESPLPVEPDGGIGTSTSVVDAPVVEAADSPLAVPAPAETPAAAGDHGANNETASEDTMSGAVQGVPVTGIPQVLLSNVLADASQRSGLPAEQLVVTRAESTTWNDGSMGCPEPGMMYTQALVDGYRIVVQAGDQAIDYRAGSNGTWRICKKA